MEKYDEATAHYRKLNPYPMQYTYLVRLDIRLYQSLIEDELEQVIELWFGKQGRLHDPQRLQLTLYGAVLTKSGSVLYPGGSFYIDIVSMRERQWSRLHYALIDLENHDELVYCRKFEAKMEDFSLDSLD